MQAVQRLIEVLEVKAIAKGQFLGQPGPGSYRIYGGVTITQALDAARQCCPPEFWVQSLHGQFLRPGDHQHPIEIQVEALKDGRHFKLHNVYCRQQGKIIFFATVTFHLPESSYQHSLVPPELRLPGVDKARFYPHRQQSWNRQQMAGRSAAFEVRIEQALQFELWQEPDNQTWFRTVDCPDISCWQHILLLAYASDWNMPSVAMRPHRVEEGYMPSLASLDHAIWFYRPPQLHDWVAYVQESPAAWRGRGHTRGLFYDQCGELLAAVSQESYLVSHKKPPLNAD